MYVCAVCKCEFEGTRTDEEAMAECRENFGDIPIEDTMVVCDDCYKAITIGGKAINWN